MWFELMQLSLEWKPSHDRWIHYAWLPVPTLDRCKNKKFYFQHLVSAQITESWGSNQSLSFTKPDSVFQGVLCPSLKLRQTECALCSFLLVATFRALMAIQVIFTALTIMYTPDVSSDTKTSVICCSFCWIFRFNNIASIYTFFLEFWLFCGSLH